MHILSGSLAVTNNSYNGLKRIVDFIRLKLLGSEFHIWIPLYTGIAAHIPTKIVSITNLKYFKVYPLYIRQLVRKSALHGGFTSVVDHNI